MEEFPVPAGSHPHDVAPALDGGVWYTAQFTGALGWLDPTTGDTREVPLGAGSSPHGVIVGPDGAPWITDSGLNAIVRVDPATERGHRLRASRRPPQRQPEHRCVRPEWDALVHGSERCVRSARSVHREHDRLRCATRSWSIRNHCHPGRHRLLRIARRQSHRAGRSRHW